MRLIERRGPKVGLEPVGTMSTSPIQLERTGCGLRQPMRRYTEKCRWSDQSYFSGTNLQLSLSQPVVHEPPERHAWSRTVGLVDHIYEQGT